MKSKRVKIATLILGILILISLSALVIIYTHNYGFASVDASGVTFSEETDEQNKTVITDSRTIVYATYNFVYINDSECSVKIANKAEATVAVIPNKGVIDGKEYSVTEIAANGFASSPKLERVRLSAEIKK